MDGEIRQLLLLAAASPFGILIRTDADPRALYQRIHKDRRRAADPIFENLQIKAAREAFGGEGDFVIYKKRATLPAKRDRE